MDEYEDQLQQEQIYKPKLFTYPDWDKPIGVFDFEELENEDSMLVLCVRKEPDNPERPDHIAYVWKGPVFDLEAFDES